MRLRFQPLSLACLGLSACLSSPSMEPRPVPEVTEDVYARFRLQHAPASGPRRQPVAVLGTAGLPEARPAASVQEPAQGEPAEGTGSDSPVELPGELPVEVPVEVPGGASDDSSTSTEPSLPAAEEAPLHLEEIVRSVEIHFPLIQAALEQVEIAAGQVQGAQGAFDTKLTSKNRFDVQGFYENDRIDVGFEQATPFLGTIFSGGYRRGAGDFAVYDGKAKTNDDGEFRIGMILPLLRGSVIDENRVALWQSRIDQQLVEPEILAKRLSATQKAASSYWKWVARGEKLRIARSLLDLAEDREEQIRAAVEEGLLARINLVDNERLIVEREANLVRAQRGLQEAAILMSLFLRDADGNPVVVLDGRLPGRFPVPRDPEQVILPEGIDLAVAQRPEVRAIELEISRLELDLDLARNARLADLDVGVFASQDVGDAVNDPDDKGPFELEARVQFELPLQRRKARGKEREVTAKISKRQRELRLAKDQVIIQVQDVVSALTQSYERVNQASENVRLALELEDAERLSLRLGESDLFRVNLREQQTAIAASSLVDVQAEYFDALASYRAVLGVPYDEVLAGMPIGGAPLP